MKKLLFLLLIPLTLHAEDKPLLKDKLFWSSSAVYWTGTVLDVQSSNTMPKGLIEGNSFYRNPDGSANTGKNLLVSSGIYVVTVLIDKKWPKARPFASLFRFTYGGLRTYQSIKNYQLESQY
jgi:hypothetical protein